MITEASTRLVRKLMILCFIFTLCQLGSEFKSQSLAQTLPYEEARALTAIASKLKLDTMISGSGVCEDSSSYTGITCNCAFKDHQNNTICHITQVRLSRRGLTGVIPEEVVNLTHLNTLDLSENQLTGFIPASLGYLSLLYWLDLSNNLLSGSIPESLGNMKFQVLAITRSHSCKEAFIRDCYRYPSEDHGDMLVERKLYSRYGKQLPPGSRAQKNQPPESHDRKKQPPEESMVTVYIWFQLDLSGNQLSGSIPATLGNVVISKEISDSDGYQLFMQRKSVNVSNFNLDLSNNQLTGLIPESFGNLTFTRYLKLNHNFLNGSIPASLGALTYLYELNLGNNEISGTLPETLGNLTHLEYFFVGSNSITGTLPIRFASLMRLSGFYVAGNLLSGPLPDFIADWTLIRQLSLSGNNFNGSIPARIFNLSYLQVLEISDVGDSDFQFPPSTKLTYTLNTLILRNCSISGTIPAYIGNLSSLQKLDLSFNKLTGSIPDSLKKVNLSYMSFSNNILTGTIPDWILNSTVMDLSYNNFSKLSFTPSPKQPVNLFACCCYNSSTCVPKTIDATRIMEKYCPRGRPKYHSLFINCGGGQINNMEGNVYDKDNETSLFYMSPKGNWARSTTENTIYGVKCGLSSEALLYDKARSSRVSMRYYGFCLRKGKYSVTLHFAEIVEDKNYTTEKRVFDVYIQGERKLKDFNIMNKTGALNKVYKQNFTAVNVNDSTLEIHFYSSGQATPDYGPLISAISVTPEYKLEKQLSPLHIALIAVASTIVFVLLLLLFAWMMGWLGNTDHLQEIDIGLEKKVTLKQVKDATRNFSKRNEIGRGGFGTVYKAEVQGKFVAVKKLSSPSEEKINQLKNEFCNLKSMSHENIVQLLDVYNAKGLHLLIYEYMQNNSLAHALFDSKSKLKLDWEARFNICLGIAKGLVYLHERPRKGMVHRDIKSANILLDGDLKPKISDFMLASLYTEDDEFKFIKVEMTQGYMSPEYVRGTVTSKADVYSFGVVILETVSGRTNAGNKGYSQESEFLLDTAYDLHRKGRLVDLVDKNLSNKYDARQAIIILNLAVKCTSISPTVRPTMSQVVSVLVGDKKIEEICPPAQVDSSATSSNYIKSEDEIKHISESTPLSNSK